MLSDSSVDIKLKLEVVTTTEVIARRISKAVRDTLNDAFINAEPIIKGRLSRMIASAVRSNPTYLELVNGGRLWNELGVVNPRPGLENLIELINLTHDFNFSRFRALGTGGVKGKLQIKFFDDQVDQYITTEGAYDTTKGSKIEWLEWLLKQGDKIAVREYVFVLGGRQFSRTGGGLMRHTGKQGWRVPPEHSGTPRNNFVTRAIDDNFDKIVAMVEKELFKAL